MWARSLIVQALRSDSHGIDSLNCTLGSLLETACVALGHTRKGAFTALVPCLPMFFSTWETYHTHTLYLGFFNGPTGMYIAFQILSCSHIAEGLILACLFMTVSGTFGPQFWHNPVSSWLGYANILGDTSPMDLWLPMIFITFFVAHLPACVMNVAEARRKNGLPLAPVFLEWTPMIVYTFGCAAWLGSPYTSLLVDQRLVLFCLTMSLVFGRMTTKIILAHLTRQPFPYWTVMLVPLLGGALIANLPYLGYPRVSTEFEVLYLRLYFVFACVVYLQWAILVIQSICSYLGINCLTITPKRDAPSSSNGSVEKKEN